MITAAGTELAMRITLLCAAWVTEALGHRVVVAHELRSIRCSDDGTYSRCALTLQAASTHHRNLILPCELRHLTLQYRSVCGVECVAVRRHQVGPCAEPDRRYTGACGCSDRIEYMCSLVKDSLLIQVSCEK